MSGEVTFLLVSVGVLTFGLLLTLVRKMINEKLASKRIQLTPAQLYADIKLGTINGCGMKLYGGENIRRYQGEQPICHVYYHFFVLLFLPIIPLGCYVAECVEDSFNYSSYNVGSDQEMNFMELLYVYVTSWRKWFIIVGVILTVFAVIILID